MRTVLNYCSALSLLVIIAFLVTLLFNVYNKLFRGKPISISLSVFGDYKANIVLYVLSVVGFANIAGNQFLATNQIGSFYERWNYKEQYEAELYVGDGVSPVFCIAELNRLTEDYDGRTYSGYYISRIFLPYGQVASTEEEYYPEQESSSIALGDYGVPCRIMLADIAKEDSYKRLENEVVSANGNVVASKNGGSYHHEECSHAQRIKRDNLIRFNSTAEAEAFGFVVCEDCDYW